MKVCTVLLAILCLPSIFARAEECTFENYSKEQVIKLRFDISYPHTLHLLGFKRNGELLFTDYVENYYFRSLGGSKGGGFSNYRLDEVTEQGLTISIQNLVHKNHSQFYFYFGFILDGEVFVAMGGAPNTDEEYGCLLTESPLFLKP